MGYIQLNGKHYHPGNLCSLVLAAAPDLRVNVGYKKKEFKKKEGKQSELPLATSKKKDTNQTDDTMDLVTTIMASNIDVESKKRLFKTLFTSP